MKEWPGDTGSSSGDHIMDGDDETVAATASLAVAITALFFAVFMTIIVLILFYFLLRLRGDVKRLHTVVGAQSTVENGSSQLNAINRLNHPPDIPTESEPVLDQKPTLPPPTPTTPKVTTPPQSIPQSPPHVFSNTGGEMECVEPVRSTTPRDAYDNVNLLSGILPPELRTAENLEGRPLQLEEVKKLEEMERESYEEIEMSMKRKEEAVAAMREMVGSPGGQGGGQIFEDDYTSPVDALKGKKAAVKETNVGSVKQNKDESKRFMVKSPPFDDEHVPGVYTAVFDQLPSGEKEVVAKQHKAVGRGASDTSPLIDRKNVEGGEGGGGRVDVCGYEDLSDELFIGARSAPTQDSPLFTSVGNITSSGTQSSPKGDKKVELNKRFSHPPHATRRDATKEMVEVNPRSRKPVTLSSGRRKQLKTDQGEKEGVDGERDSDSLSPTTKNSTSEPGTQDSYALVDLTGKHRYRAESDSMKREGSGAPKHYTVKECPPDTDGMPEQTVDS